MFKPCPKCGFLVALIAGREASQRCPRCGSVLMTESELLGIEDTAPGPRADRTPAAEVALVPAPADAAVPDQPTLQATATDTTAVAAVAPAADTDAAAGVHADNVATHDGPSFARRRVRTRDGDRRWRGWTAIGALIVLLALQLLLAQRDALARDAAWRPWVLRACGVLRCTVPAWHEPQAFAMIARGVRPDPARRGVLHVTATVRNDARWPQRAPVVVLSLSDVDGRVVGARAVPPADYGRPDPGEVAPGDSVDIAFDVREPAAHVESFDFQLQ